jgi:hypothetical protein
VRPLQTYCPAGAGKRSSFSCGYKHTAPLGQDSQAHRRNDEHRITGTAEPNISVWRIRRRRLQRSRMFVDAERRLFPAPAEPNVCRTRAPSASGSSGAECL